MKLPYYPGCTLKSNANNFEVSAIAAAEKLGIELVEIPRWNCCGAVHSLATDNLMYHLAPARNFIRVEEMNKNGLVDNEYRMLTLCSMCYNTLKRTNLRIKENNEELDKLNEFMNLEEDYEGKVEVVHFLEILKEYGFDNVAKYVKNPLDKLTIAPYYGCTLLRPKEISIDVPESPTIQEDLFQSLGAKVVSFPYNKMCCGSYQTVQNKNSVVDLAYKILTQAQNFGAEIVVTSCPLCAFNLDTRQKLVKEKYPEFKPIPVLYFTQLMAIALGADEKSYGLDKNTINPIPLLKEKEYIK